MTSDPTEPTKTVKPEMHLTPKQIEAPRIAKYNSNEFEPRVPTVQSDCVLSKIAPLVV